MEVRRKRMDGTGIEQVWKVGELATTSGLTVRTLHHYDRIGLVRPGARTSSGHRLYSEADVQRLYQVLALRQLGLGLEKIAQVLTGTVAMAQVLAAHRDYLAAQVAATQDLHALVLSTSRSSRRNNGHWSFGMPRMRNSLLVILRTWAPLRSSNSSSACRRLGTTSTRLMFRRTPTSLRFFG